MHFCRELELRQAQRFADGYSFPEMIPK